MKSNLYYEQIESKIIVNLKNTKKSLKIAMAWFTNPNLYNLIVQLIDKNVHVELILSDDRLNFTNPEFSFQELINKNISIRVSESPYLMHNKFCIIDNRIVLTGSYNWTLKAEKYNRENIIISTDDKLVNDFIVYFDKLKSELKIVESISQIPLKKHVDKDEEETELSLLKKEIPKKVEIQKNDTPISYNEELQSAIDESTLLYLKSQIKECLTYTKVQIQKYKNIPAFYYNMAYCYWRLGDYQNQIKYAEKILEIEDVTEQELLDGYNMLGIAYSYTKGGEQKSIEYFKNCINAVPDEHNFYRNRAAACMVLESLPSLPLDFKEKYRNQADDDLNKIIEIANNSQVENYNLLHSKAFAYYKLGYDNPNKRRMALDCINKAIDLYKIEKDKFKKDENEFKDIKELQREIKYSLTRV